MLPRTCMSAPRLLLIESLLCRSTAMLLSHSVSVRYGYPIMKRLRGSPGWQVASAHPPVHNAGLDSRTCCEWVCVELPYLHLLVEAWKARGKGDRSWPIASEIRTVKAELHWVLTAVCTASSEATALAWKVIKSMLYIVIRLACGVSIGTESVVIRDIKSPSSQTSSSCNALPFALGLYVPLKTV